MSALNIGAFRRGVPLAPSGSMRAVSRRGWRQARWRRIVEVPPGEAVAQLCYLRPMRSENGKARAVLLPVDDDTDLESLLLSQNKRLWELIDRSIAGSGKRRRTRLEDLPE